MSQPVRVRFAPSPTGYLHVGGARTALYNFLFAKNQGGKFILRIEDTDLERSTEESLRMQISDLQWLGLNWDEGVDPVTLADQGKYGPYRQSQRTEIYKKYADELLEKGMAYYCFLTDEEMETQRAHKKEQGLSMHIESPYRDLSLGDAKKKIEQGGRPTIRLKVPTDKKEYVVHDLIRGDVKWPSDVVGDFVIIRSNGMPVYNFCCAIDDALMKITHVFRAEEHLNNTLRQMMVIESLGMPIPQFGHLSIILGADKQKLSKRHGATSCNEYRERGYLPEALNNFISLLGWSHPEGKELMSREEMINSFSYERFNSSPAVFDEVKLTWMNSMHLRELPHDQLWERLQPFFEKAQLSLPSDKAWQDKALGVFKSSMETLLDGVALFEPLSTQGFVLSNEATEVLQWEPTVKVFKTWIDLVRKSGLDYFSEDNFKEAQNQIKEICSVKGKNLFMPIRVAIIGKPHGADLNLLVPLIKTETLIQRAEFALKQCV